MAITVYQGSHGRIYTFVLYEKDGSTKRNLTNMTVIWRLKAMDDPTVLLALSTTVTDPTNGGIEVVMDASLSGTARDWDSQFEVASGSSLLDPSDFIVVNVVKSAAVAG